MMVGAFFENVSGVSEQPAAQKGDGVRILCGGGATVEPREGAHT